MEVMPLFCFSHSVELLLLSLLVSGLLTTFKHTLKIKRLLLIF